MPKTPKLIRFEERHIAYMAYRRVESGIPNAELIRRLLDVEMDSDIKYNFTEATKGERKGKS